MPFLHVRGQNIVNIARTLLKMLDRARMQLEIVLFEPAFECDCWGSIAAKWSRVPTRWSTRTAQATAHWASLPISWQSCWSSLSICAHRTEQKMKRERERERADEQWARVRLIDQWVDLSCDIRSIMLSPDVDDSRVRVGWGWVLIGSLESMLQATIVSDGT